MLGTLKHWFFSLGRWFLVYEQSSKDLSDVLSNLDAQRIRKHPLLSSPSHRWGTDSQKICMTSPRLKGSELQPKSIHSSTVSGARANQRKCRLSTPKGRKWTRDHSPISCFMLLLMVPPRIQTWLSSLRHPSPLSPKLNSKLPVKVALCWPQKNYKFHGLKPRLFETWTLPLSPNLPNKHIVQGFLRVGMVISLQKFICNDD